MSSSFSLPGCAGRAILRLVCLCLLVSGLGAVSGPIDLDHRESPPAFTAADTQPGSIDPASDEHPGTCHCDHVVVHLIGFWSQAAGAPATGPCVTVLALAWPTDRNPGPDLRPPIA